MEINGPYTMPKKTRYIMLGVAAGLLLLVVIWFIFRSSAYGLNEVAEKINSYGYSFLSDDLFVAYDNADTSIADVMEDVDLTSAVEASRMAGFSSDVYKRGGVTLILANSGDDIVTVYLVDGEIELCFIQTTNGNVRALEQK